VTPGVGLVIALRREASALFGRVRWMDCGNGQSWGTTPHRDKTVTVVRSGPGIRNAQRAGRWLVSSHAAIIGSVGVSGGLSPRLGKGDLVLADEIILWNGETYERAWKSDASSVIPLFVALQENRVPVKHGRILTTKRPALTLREKAVHFRETGALAVDMESAGVAEEAKKAGIPFFALRAVCDPADMTIPHFISDCLDSNGNIRSTYLCGQLLKNPFGVVALLGLQRCFTLAVRHLKVAWEGRPLQQVLLRVMTPLDRS